MSTCSVAEYIFSREDMLTFIYLNNVTHGPSFIETKLLGLKIDNLIIDWFKTKKYILIGSYLKANTHKKYGQSLNRHQILICLVA